jgi:hypothetical protein
MKKENIKNKEEGKVKAWIKKHKTVLSVGATSLVGIGVSVVTHRIGYNDGHYTGYDLGFKEACNFNEEMYNAKVTKF